MSEYDGNFGEREALEQFDLTAYERDTEAEEMEHMEVERLDRLRRDWPIPTGKKVA